MGCFSGVCKGCSALEALLPPPLHRRGDAHRFTIFRYRPTRDLYAFFIELLDDQIIGKYRFRPLRREDLKLIAQQEGITLDEAIAAVMESIT
jgi:hypothetical protein